MPTVSVLEYALPQRPPQGPEDDRDLSERALPRRSTSPVIGSPPVRAVPIGTPPKQMAVPSFNQQVPFINVHSPEYWESGQNYLGYWEEGGHCG